MRFVGLLCLALPWYYALIITFSVCRFCICLLVLRLHCLKCYILKTALVQDMEHIKTTSICFHVLPVLVFHLRGSTVIPEMAVRLPCNHFLLLVGWMSSTSQDFCRGGEEVQAMVLEVLIHKWQENLGAKTRFSKRQITQTQPMWHSIHWHV